MWEGREMTRLQTFDMQIFLMRVLFFLCTESMWKFQTTLQIFTHRNLIETKGIEKNSKNMEPE